MIRKGRLFLSYISIFSWTFAFPVFSFFSLYSVIAEENGHVDAGKSTLMGHLLYLLGNVNKRTMHKYEQESKKAGKASFAYAWVLDETGEERER
uniref:Tr-type G domain-containing protein n=1 Tax=Pavo cristatus TaxID=9049 RepID=A0A8C9LFJ0_PAVCR